MKKSAKKKAQTDSVSGVKELKQNSVKQETDGSKSIFVIGIGASAGGLDALAELAAQIPANVNAAFFVVLHLSKAAMGDVLIERIRRKTRLPCKIAQDQEEIEAGVIFVAAPDAHLLVKDNRVIIGRGPAENRFRPSIDVLFRSLAANFGDRAIGIVLTGFLNDGTAGMWAIKQSGGYCIVQDPNEAEYPDMPLSVLETMEADYCLPLQKMGNAIKKIILNPTSKGITPPDHVVLESKLSEKVATGIEQVMKLGGKSFYSCPDCGGSLWKIDDGRIGHYRCHIGHSYTDADLILKQAESIEQTIWVAVRMMEERKILMKKLAKENNEKGLNQLAKAYSNQALQLAAHIDKLKELLFAIHND
jgi:two-component system chemotaxis response regulator CheB